MTTLKRRLFLNALKLFDVAVMIGAFLSAAVIVLHRSDDISAAAFFTMRVRVQNFVLFAFLLLVWHLILCFFGLYASRRFSSRKRELRDIIAATSIGTLIILLAGVLFRIRMATPLFLFSFWIGATLLTASSRLLLGFTLRFARKRERNLRYVIIAGTNSRALQFAQRIASRPELGYRVIGFVDREWERIAAFRASGHSLVSDIASFPDFLRHSVVDEVVIGLPFRSMHGSASLIAAACQQQGVTVRVLSDIFDLKPSRQTAEEELDADALLAHTAGWIEDWPVFIKRMVDIGIACIGIILFSPILVLAAILIKRTSPGPVLFIQKRVGLHKRPLNVYKLRTMHVDAEERIHELEHLNEVSGPVFKLRNDPRLTRAGRILRKTSIDELPQLFNVLKGEMSLVGPRPLPVRDYEGFSEDWQRRRFSVKPGMTCLWQIHGRSSIAFAEWMALDLQYIDKWSLWLDFRILLQTIPAVLRGSGAA
jgi:exopolysaccharide biosynthesis polyprenyl glycosylphosphotransferase